MNQPNHSDQRPDIALSQDIKRMVDTFYEKVCADEEIGYIFNDVAKVDWAHHLPVMYAFWEFLLLDNPDGYRGNPIEKHYELHRKHPLKVSDFDRWVMIFQQTVDELFAGPAAEQAKFRAFSIAETWKHKFTGPFGV